MFACKCWSWLYQPCPTIVQGMHTVWYYSTVLILNQEQCLHVWWLLWLCGKPRCVVLVDIVVNVDIPKPLEHREVTPQKYHHKPDLKGKAWQVVLTSHGASHKNSTAVSQLAHKSTLKHIPIQFRGKRRSGSYTTPTKTKQGLQNLCVHGIFLLWGPAMKNWPSWILSAIWKIPLSTAGLSCRQWWQQSWKRCMYSANVGMTIFIPLLSSPQSTTIPLVSRHHLVFPVNTTQQEWWDTLYDTGNTNCLVDIKHKLSIKYFSTFSNQMHTHTRTHYISTYKCPSTQSPYKPNIYITIACVCAYVVMVMAINSNKHVIVHGPVVAMSTK